MGCSNNSGCSSQPQGCPDQYGCTGACPDFTIRRGDTKPAFKVKMEDCDGPMDLVNLVLEASMWAKGKLKTAITPQDTYFALADNIGFNQMMVGDIIIMDRPRLPEKMLVVGFDEDNKLVLVQRGYQGTTPGNWKRGSQLKIMKFMNAQAQTEMIYEDILQIDGTTDNGVLTDSFFIYEWGPNDTCLPGCYYLEFKLIKMLNTPEQGPQDYHHTPSCVSPWSYPAGTLYGPIGPFVPDGSEFSPGVYNVPGTPEAPVFNQLSDNCGDNSEPYIVFSPSVISNLDVSQIVLPDVTPFPSVIYTDAIAGCSNMSFIVPSFTPPSDTPSTFGCGIPSGVEWMRRFPVDSEGFYIQIIDAPPTE